MRRKGVTVGLGVGIPLHPMDLVVYFLVDGAQRLCVRFAPSAIGLIRAKKQGKTRADRNGQLGEPACRGR